MVWLAPGVGQEVRQEVPGLRLSLQKLLGWEGGSPAQGQRAGSQQEQSS